MANNELRSLLREKSVLICAGAGGVGKTTTAAALAIQAALLGKRVLVLTIDPAKRLATSLGLPELGHKVMEIDEDVLAKVGTVQAGGKLFAMMLDQKLAFDEVIEECATSPEAVKRVFANPIYQQISTSLAGSQEYAAMTKLQQFHSEGNYDLLVVDTPPTAHALDFLDAPKRMTQALNSTALKWFKKSSGNGAVERTGKFILKRLSKFVGSQFVDDIGVFFSEFEDVTEGFKKKADETFSLLRGESTSFILVASPAVEALQEAVFFYERLQSTSMPFGHFIINRVHRPSPPLPSADAMRDAPPQLVAVAKNWQKIVTRDANAVTMLSKHHACVAICPASAKDVHSIESLGELGQTLLASDV